MMTADRVRSTLAEFLEDLELARDDLVHKLYNAAPDEDARYDIEEIVEDYDWRWRRALRRLRETLR